MANINTLLERTGTAYEAFDVTPSDDTDLARPARALYIGGTGDVEVIPLGGTAAVVFHAHPVGYMPVAVKRVLAANTTATDIVALPLSE